MARNRYEYEDEDGNVTVTNVASGGAVVGIQAGVVYGQTVFTDDDDDDEIDW